MSVASGIIERAAASAQTIRPLQCVPSDFHHESIVYLFICYTGEKWHAELLIDPIYNVPPSWCALVDELNMRVLPVFDPYAKIGGYYPILFKPLTDEVNIPFELLKVGVNIPNFNANTDVIDFNLFSTLKELPVLLQAFGLGDSFQEALRHDHFAIFAYLCQMVIIKLAPWCTDTSIYPHVVDEGTRLQFVSTNMLSSNDFLHLMNNLLFGNMYDGYKHLCGTYLICTQDALNCRDRTLMNNDASFDPSSWFDTCAAAKRYYMIELLQAVHKNKYKEICQS